MKTIAIIKYAFAAIGLALLAGGLLWWQSTRSFLAQASMAEGTVVALRLSRSSDSSAYYPVVRYATADGRTIEFVSSAGSNPPSYSEGEKVQVLFQPANPRHAKINGFFSLWGGPLIFGGLGAVFLAIGGGIIAATTLSARRGEYLRTHGMPVQASFRGVELNESLTVNGSHPWRIVTQWQDPATSQVHVFRSANLWFDPSEYIRADKLTVFIDPVNPKKHWVDVSFLPKPAG